MAIVEDLNAVRRLPQQDRARLRVERILDAAVEILRSNGLSGLSMSAVAARAGVTLPSLYRYFADRESVLMAVAVRYFEELHARFDEGLAGLRTTEQARAAVSRTLWAYYDAFRSDAALAVIWGGALSDSRLAAMNAEDSQRNGALLAQRIGPFSSLEDTVLLRRCVLACHLTLATVSLALSLPANEARAYVEEFGGWADGILFG